MKYKIDDYNDIALKCESLNCTVPDTFSFLPENFSNANNIDEFIYAESVVELRKIFKQNNIQLTNLELGTPKFRVRKYADWIGPTLFISFSLLSENNHLISIGLNVLSNYVGDFFKGSLDDKKVKFDIVVETTKEKEYKRIKYEGDPEGIKQLDKIIKSLNKK
ncbi:MAG: hypothetical protein ACFB15_10865 [Cyclobacteriaceae bacterium]